MPVLHHHPRPISTWRGPFLEKILPRAFTADLASRQSSSASSAAAASASRQASSSRTGALSSKPPPPSHPTSGSGSSPSPPSSLSPSSSSASATARGGAPFPHTTASHSLAGLGTTQLSPDIMLRCTIFDSSGSATSTSGVFKKSSLCSEHGLEPRDLRKIDSRVPNLVPTILARRGGILVNILHIRAMIKKDKVLLFDSYGSTDSQLHSAFVYNLQHNLRPFQSQHAHHTHTHGHASQAVQASPSPSSGSPAGSSSGSGSSNGHLAYEFRALESILVSVLDALRIELDVVRTWTSQILNELDDDVDRDKLRTLLQVSRKLNAFLSRAKAVKNAVVEVLENDEDMQLMYLSVPPSSGFDSASASASAASKDSSSGKKNDSLPDAGLESGSNARHDEAAGSSTKGEYGSTAPTAPSDGSPRVDELELLLESFDKQVEEVVAETSQLHSDITNTQEVVELILDNNRNKLLALDLKTSIATMGISAGTLWAGLFGMNLKSHMEEIDWAFTVVSGVAFAAVGLTAGLGLRRLERLRRVGLGQKLPLQKKNKGRLADWWNRYRLGARKQHRDHQNAFPTQHSASSSQGLFGDPAHHAHAHPYAASSPYGHFQPLQHAWNVHHGVQHPMYPPSTQAAHVPASASSPHPTGPYPYAPTPTPPAHNMPDQHPAYLSYPYPPSPSASASASASASMGPGSTDTSTSPFEAPQSPSSSSNPSRQASDSDKSAYPSPPDTDLNATPASSSTSTSGLGIGLGGKWSKKKPRR
ncbi:cora-domain-containing protein [Testicularia cyperi]|uniref:Cora-domain-containing protein n=1 Tax=Testicularia cyperi TaxID=1882483 RepID=A0A317XSG6_9BASI|nr:cora-domain-containing protein [Testicularia cyperi]